MITIGAVWLFVYVIGHPPRQIPMPSLKECERAAAVIRKQQPGAYVVCDR